MKRRAGSDSKGSFEVSRSSRLILNRYLDIALVCEHHNDLGMARAAAVKAAQVKRGCQGVDFPNYKKYVEVLDRIKTKLALQENEHDV